MEYWIFNITSHETEEEFNKRRKLQITNKVSMFEDKNIPKMGIM
jgi:hypothetical protein